MCHFSAFVRILCVCCPRKIRRKYQPTMRSKSQVSFHTNFPYKSTASSCTQWNTARGLFAAFSVDVGRSIKSSGHLFSLIWLTNIVMSIQFEKKNSLKLIPWTSYFNRTRCRRMLSLPLESNECTHTMHTLPSHFATIQHFATMHMEEHVNSVWRGLRQQSRCYLSLFVHGMKIATPNITNRNVCGWWALLLRLSPTNYSYPGTVRLPLRLHTQLLTNDFLFFFSFCWTITSTEISITEKMLFNVFTTCRSATSTA